MPEPTLDDWVSQWRSRASRASPLTGDEWRHVKASINDTYTSAGLDPPDAVIRARSPREALAMTVQHQRGHAARRLSAPSRITEAIRASERRMLQRVPFTGAIADRVDARSFHPMVWGTELHPDMLRSPGSGNAQVGVAAEVSWIIETTADSVPDEVLRRLQAIAGRSLAGPARFLDDLVFVSDLPTRFRTDEGGRPHCADAPAILWGDGTGLNFWHGTRVPEDFFTWTPEKALSAVNVEVRRCAFERIGVDVLERSLTLLAEAPDPANPPHMLRLYDLPRPWLGGRLLVVDNASLDKGGHRRRFQIFVPPHITDPIQAAANSFGMTAADYRRLQRAT